MSAQEPAPAPGHAGHGAALAQYARDWAEACSICFENRCDFCLPACQDQFCKPCVKRYFTEKIRDSWGLTVTKLTCPVCYDPLSIDLVKKYIDEETLVLYRKYNDPHRGLSRHCAVCQCEQAVALPTRDCDWDRLARDFDRALEDTVGDERRVSAVREELDAVHRGKGDAAALFAALLSAASHVAVHPAGDTRSRSKRRREGDDEALADGHVVLMGRIALPADVDATFTSLSRAMIRTVLVPEARLALQFLHVKAFPRHSCDRCGARMCFQCGESSWHGDGATCEDDMRARIRAICERGAVAGDGVILARDRHELDTLQWKLQNGKRCPRCCIFIERDDGCNKMDCLYCGNQFCWNCLKPWNKECGFFSCQEDTPRAADAGASGGTERRRRSSAADGVVPDADGWPAGRRDSDASSIDESERPAKRAKAEAGVPDVNALSFGKYRSR